MSEEFLKQVLDVSTGESITVPFTDEEVIAHKEVQKAMQAQIADLGTKADARKSALAKLAKLGLTADEVAAL